MKKKWFIAICLIAPLISFGQYNWISKGPLYEKSKFMGSGIVNSVECHPSDANSIYIGTYGGIWHTADGGASWTEFAASKEFEHTMTVSNVVLDKSNTNILYAATGSRQISLMKRFFAPESPTSGVYRCVINGAVKTWTKISNGLPTMTSAYGIKKTAVGYYIHTLQLDPFDSNILYAGTSIGIYVTTNAQSATPTWTKITALPTTPVFSVCITGTSALNRVIYVSGKNFISKSTDGTSWTQIAGTCSGCLDYNSDPNIAPDVNTTIADANQDIPNILDTSVYAQYYLAKSLKYPGHVYASAIVNVIVEFSASGQIYENERYYKYLVKYDGSAWDNSGNHILKLKGKAASSNNLSGYNPHITVGYNSSVSTNESIYACYEGIEGFVENASADDGSGYSYFNTGYPSAYQGGNVHPDFQDLEYNTVDNFLYGGNDGFLAKYTPVTTFADTLIDNNYVALANANLNCARIWHHSVSPQNSSKVAIGQQDNGTNLVNNGTWSFIEGGDGLDQLFHGSFYSYSYPDKCFLNNSTYKHFKDGSWQDISYPSEWYNKLFYLDPTDVNIVWMPNAWGIYKSVNQNTNIIPVADFSTLPSNGTYGYISSLAIPRFDNNIMYVGVSSPMGYAYGFGIYRTNNATAASPSWVKLPFPPMSANERCRGIAVSSVNPNTVFVSTGNNSPTANPEGRVLRSDNGGTTWSDYNDSRIYIPSLYRIHCLVYEKGSNDGLYVGTDNGIYYTNKNMNTWIRYDAGLPNIAVTALDYHPKDNKLIASTWGRGVWEVYPYCLTAGTVNITQANHSNYMNHPTQANGTITFNYSQPPLTGPPPSHFRYELRSTTMVDFLPGTTFNAAYYPPFCTIEAYITPCNGQSSARTGISENETSIDKNVAHLLDNQSNDSDLTIYPNPNAGEVKIVLDLVQDETAVVSIVDIGGKEVYNNKITGTNQLLEIDFRDKPDGLYIVKVTKKGKVTSGKLILSKIPNTMGPIASPIPKGKRKK